MRTLFLILLLLPATVASQQIGVEGSVWSFSDGYGTKTNPSASVRLGLPLRTAYSVLQAGVTLTAERDDAPGLLHLEVELVRRLLRTEDRSANLFISGGVGGLRFAADKQQAIIAECARNPLCFYEAASYQTGWRPTVSAGVGADFPIASTLMLQPTARVVAPLGPADAGPSDKSYLMRFGVGLTWRR